MIEVFPFAGLPIAVMGLGKSGMAAAKALIKSGAEVWAWDDDPARREQAERAHIPIVDLYKKDLGEATTIVWSPGIPHADPKPHLVAERARKAGLEIICDIELLGRSQRNAAYIGITGTNGKSTTTALVGHILSLSGREVQVGGNLGTPVLELEPLDEGGVYVLEMSSYQLELTLSITFDIAVLINISPDHLDRHGGMEGYIAAKKNIFRRQTKPRTAVIGVDDAYTRGIYDGLRAADDQIVVPISSERRIPGGVYVMDGRLIDDTQGEDSVIADLTGIPTLPGRHNWQNAAAAFAAAKPVGLPPAVIAACLRSFPGLAHRQELVAVIDGVRYVNDSKATNAAAAEKAIVCYERIYWIAGGRAKEGGIASLAPHFHRIARAYLIGESAEAFAETIEGKVPYTLSRTLDRAVAAAAEAAVRDKRAGVVVLLSPACASWDQFANFEARGEAFRALVEALPGTRDEITQTEVMQ